MRCEEVFEVLISLSKNIYGEESTETAYLYSDLGNLYNVLLLNDKSLSTLKKAQVILKKQPNYQNDTKYQQLINTMSKVT